MLFLHNTILSPFSLYYLQMVENQTLMKFFICQLFFQLRQGWLRVPWIAFLYLIALFLCRYLGCHHFSIHYSGLKFIDCHYSNHSIETTQQSPLRIGQGINLITKNQNKYSHKWLIKAEYQVSPSWKNIFPWNPKQLRILQLMKEVILHQKFKLNMPVVLLFHLNMQNTCVPCISSRQQS